MPDSLKELRKLLDGIAPGPIRGDIREEIVDLLAGCWDVFDRPDTKLDAHKLSRIESLRWNPPILSFTIERHKGIVHGSTRAELQHWSVDLNSVTADYTGTYHQVYPRQAPWEAEPIAKQVAQSIIKGSEDLRLKWLGPAKVKILTRKILPQFDSSPKQTTEGRRRRFYHALDNYLEPLGWKRNRNIYESKVSSPSPTDGHRPPRSSP